MAVKQRHKKEGDHSETWEKSLSRDERSCFKTVGGNVFGIQKEVHSLLSKKLSEDGGAESEPRKLVEV